jgi:pimeloyl-ACP methyl ester carboxylesterase
MTAKAPQGIVNQRVSVNIAGAMLTPALTIPLQPRGLVVVPSASGDRTYERANRAVTTALWEAGFATLEVDLFTHAEAVEDAESCVFRNDMDLIAGRMAGILQWVNSVRPLRTLEIGIFAAGTCASGALVTAAERPDLIQSIACRSARLEQARDALVYVHAPVLLMLGERDIAHRAEHATAMTLLPPRSHLEIVPGARHLLDRPEDIPRVAALAIGWFGETLTPRWVMAGTWVGPVRELAVR